MPHWIACLAVTGAALAAGCGPSVRVVAPPPATVPEGGAHHDAIAAQVQPFLDSELVTSLVVGVYDAGKIEVYGFGAGPGGAPPDGSTLFELGPVTKVYTSILFADAVQRREVALDTPLAELLPPGVTAPVRDNTVITLGQLGLHTGGLPRMPPSLLGHVNDPDPFAGYNEDRLYNDLIRTQLVTTPGTQLSYSTYGGGLLAFVLGKKLAGSYAKAVTDRVLKPLALSDTYIAVPTGVAARRVAGTNDDLAKVPPWSYGALLGAGGLVSDARDQLRLIEAELDAASGGALPLRRAMKLTQEAAFDRPGANEGLGWTIDSDGRYWHNGNTSGCHAFIGFDAKTKRGVVVLASTASALIDRIAEATYKILDSQNPPPVVLPKPEQLAELAGSYALSDTKLQIVVAGKRLYIEGPGEPRHRLSPISDHEFWIEALQSFATFEKTGDKVTRVVFGIGDRALAAARVADAAVPAAPTPPAPPPSH